VPGTIKLQSTLQPAAEVLTFLEASATKCQLELSCHSLRCGNHPFYTLSGLVSWNRILHQKKEKGQWGSGGMQA
jgi:hypothetical protein